MPAFTKALGDDFEVDQEILQEAMQRPSRANNFYLPWVTKVDLFGVGSTPFDEAEFSRRSRVRVRQTGEELFLKSPEDTVLRKLLWFRLGGKVSDKQWRDIVEVLKVSGPTLSEESELMGAAAVRYDPALSRARGRGELTELPARSARERRTLLPASFDYVVTVRILALCGSLQARSSNLDLLKIAVTLAPTGVEVVLFDGLRDLPLFNPDIEAASAAPVSVDTWRRALAASDALLVVTPEYGFSPPGALKNAIYWVIGSGELERKVVAITAVTNHAERGRKGLEALRGTLTALSVTIVVGEPLVRGPTFESEVARLVAALVEATRSVAPTNE